MSELTTQDISILRISDKESVPFSSFLEADAILIESTNLRETTSRIEAIRSSASETIFLKPVFVLTENKIEQPYIVRLSDGIIRTESELPAIEEITAKIIKRCIELPGMDESFMLDEAKALSKTLRFMYTRNMQQLEPLRSRVFKLGYVYPILSNTIGVSHEHMISSILDMAVAEGIFQRHFLEKIYQCNSCHDSFQHYREVCPKCQSSDLKDEEMIHHFRCAHIGSEKSFTRETGQLICPKCSKELRHIGVDYDKPSVMYTCRTCSNDFQDYLVKAHCVGCGNQSAVEYLIGTDIYKYSLTSKGEQMAGFAINIKPKEEGVTVEGTLNSEAFGQHISSFQTDPDHYALWCLGRAQFNGLKEIQDVLGNEYLERLLNDLIELIRLSLSVHDRIYFLDADHIYFTAKDVTYEEVMEKMARTELIVKKLLKDNTDMAAKVNFEYKAIEVDAPTELSDLFEYLQ